ncbi:nucleosomal histone kinase 1-like [Colias croceus]|uniref:nucleosomal histone kinase 1-like n=1 Tax=Colias crocea TaxID=72248 RepID=UPI001E27DCB1|nr:nucleosomal histone kinase 1-like [Colias croceus]
MPRRCLDTEELMIAKRKKVIEQCSSLDVSYCDDEALNPGIVFTDVTQRQWRLGKPIGRGSFGRIYLTSDEIDKEVTKLNARYVVKIEPHTNGPLFVEVHCLIRSGQTSKVRAWRQQHKQKRLGMPHYIASGSFTDENTGIRYRFLVLPRYDIDLHKVITRTKVLDLKNVLILAMQIFDVLEYLHNQGYTHSDIKSSNLMLGFDGNKFNKLQVPKPAPSFQKDTKQAVVLSRKPKRAKSSKGRTSNYYDDEDFTVRENRTSLDDSIHDKRLTSVRQKLSKILSDKDNRTLHRHHAFNLRQITSYVNYEDLNSSICSDRSYQVLLDDVSKIHDDGTNALEEIYREAILSQSNGQIYLLDYGLASKFLDSNGNHKEFGMDARKAHDGTLEYSSRDSHIGAHSRRSDLETLGYNLLDWLTGTLPWKTAEVLAEPDLVHALKKNFMSDIKLLLKTCFKTEFYPQFLEKYLQYVTRLDFTEKPDYDYCKSLFRSELLKNGYIFDKELLLNFNEAPKSPINRNCYSKRLGTKNTPPDFLARNGIKKAYERENVFSLENDLKLELLKQTLNTSSDGQRKPCSSRNFFISDADLVARLKKTLMPHDICGKKLSPKMLRSNKRNIKRKGMRRHRNSIGKFGNFLGSARQFTWAEILAGNPEDIIRKERNPPPVDTFVDDDSTCKYRIRKLSNASDNSDSNLQSPLLQKDYLLALNPTYAMKDVVANFKKKVSKKSQKTTEDCNQGFEGYTPAMIRVIKLRQKRDSKDKLEAVKSETEQIISKRCTRSMASKSKQPIKEKTVKNVKMNEVVSQKECESPKEDKNDSTPPQTRKSSRVRNKQEAKDIESPQSQKSSPKKIPVRKRTTVTVNRLRLRSSKRKK